jgi:hypothetical protein
LEGSALVSHPEHGEPGGEPGPADAELAVDVREVGLHGAQAHEELGGDLLVRATPSGEFGDPALGLGQVLRGSGPAADPPQLGLGLLDPQPRAEFLEDRKCLTDRFAGDAFLLRLPVRRPAAEQRACRRPTAATVARDRRS